jgi:hypothetical protein
VVAVLIIAGVAAVLGIATVPFLLPWPQHVRWLLTTMATPDPTGMSAGPGLLMMREVAVTEVHRWAGQVTVELTGISPVGTPTSYVLPGSAATAVAVARLERWLAAQTPLLFVADANGEASLHGPLHAVGGLRPSSASVGCAGPRLPVPRPSDRSCDSVQRGVPVLVAR